MDTAKIGKLTEPFGIEIDLEAGIIMNPENRIVRRASDMRGYYADGNALEKLIDEGDDPLHYEVLEVPVPQERGHLMYCISILQPGVVGEECFMTKGHYHSVKETAELYLCLSGKGFMAMKTATGRWAAEKMDRGKMVYVPPLWAHRSINTGKEPLVSFCVYPAEAGHNYGDIKKEGFPRRIYLRNGNEVIE
ncbi:MAG TPA: glucose-6-phosphate isomerase family protein [bacterium]|nr:glucose-6-phosphate isomerase family protein [bacterium]